MTGIHSLRTSLGAAVAASALLLTLYVGVIALGSVAWLMLLTVRAGAVELPTAKSEVRGVTVSVTPLNVSPEAKRWSFTIVLDTHTQPLNDDFSQTVTLTASDGRPLKPLSWEGAAPGGHHRQVVVHFAPPSPLPATVELRVDREGEPMARVFRFDTSRGEAAPPR